MNNNQNSSDQSSATGLLRYNLLLALLLPLLFIFILFQSIKQTNFKLFLHRLGLYFKTGFPVDIWLHAASVGEVNAAAPLIHAIHKRYPDKKILVTTITPTGAAVIENKSLSYVTHAYLPLDYPRLISGLINSYHPKILLVMETEIWPNLFRTSQQQNIPVITINGRVSTKTLDTYGWVRAIYRTTLASTTAILTRSEEDSKNYIALGAPADKVKTIGNIKFSAISNTDIPQVETSIKRKYILAASTRPDEEDLIASKWKNKQRETKNYLLVVAPRHPKRSGEILDQLNQLQLNIAVRSRGDSVTNDTDIYLIDTLGELLGFMAAAEIVFVGGSLVPLGGHNILEPAALGKPVLFGPHMDNFSSEAQLLLDFNAAIQVKDSEELGNVFVDMINSPEKYQSLATNAKKIVEQNKEVADRYVAELEKHIN